MAQVKISDLPNALALTGFESVPIVQNGVTVQTTTGAISVQPSQTQTFLTATQQPSLANSRYLATGSGLQTIDGGAQGTLQINLTGAAASLNSSGNGIQVKTASGTLTARSIAAGTGLGVINADGVSGNPQINLGSFLANVQSLSGSTGLVGVSGGSVSSLAILGTSGNISVVNGDGSTGNPKINLVTTAVTAGTYASATFTVDQFGRITNASSGTAGGVTFFSAGTTGLTPSAPTSGSITLDGVLVASNGGTGASTLTGYVYGNGTSPMTASTTIPTTALSGTITNAQLANSAITINGTSTNLGGSISVGTVTSVGGTGTVSGLTLTGTVTSSGNLTLGGTLNLASPPAIGGTAPAAGTFTTLIGGSGSANYGQLTGGATTNAVEFKTLGSDTNVSYAIQSKGTGAIDLAAGSSGVNISNGGTVTAITRTAVGTGYTSLPTVAISAPTTAGGVQAVVSATAISLVSLTSIASGGTGYTIGDVLTLSGGTFTTAIQFTVTTVSSGAITGVSVANFGNYTAIGANPVSCTGGTGTGATFNVSLGVLSLAVATAGSGYVEQPTVTFSGGGGSGAAAYATVGAGTVFRSLGSTMSFYTPNQQIAFQVADYGGSTTTGYWTAYGGNAQPILTATASNSAVIQTSSAVPLLLRTSGVEQFRVAHTASAVNYVQVTGAATGAAPNISSQGSDANVPLRLSSKGDATIYGVGNGATIFDAYGPSSSANYIRLRANATAVAPALQAFGTDTNIDLTLTPKGTGKVVITNGIQGGSF